MVPLPEPNRPLETAFLPPSATDFDAAAQALLDTILAAVDRTAGFPRRLEASLTTALSLLEEEPDLARNFAAPLAPSSRSSEIPRSWSRTFGNLLRQAARADPAVQLPPLFTEPLLIYGICARLRTELERDDPRPTALLPSLLHFVLTYYPGSQLPSILKAARETTASGE